MTYKLELFLILKKRLINIKLFKKFVCVCVCVCVCVTYKLELFLVLKKRLINIKSFIFLLLFMIYLYWTPRFLH